MPITRISYRLPWTCLLYTSRQAATLVCEKARIVGCDVNELSPHYDASGASTAVACKIVREMLLALDKEKRKTGGM